MQRPQWGFDTLQVHAGSAPDIGTNARVTPIYATAAFTFPSAEAAAAIYSLDDLTSHAYSRISNPTSSVMEARIAALEGAHSAVAVSSGQAATALSLLNLARSGDHIVASAHLYGGTVGLLRNRFVQELGIDVTFVDEIQDAAAWRRAITPRTRALFAESISNPVGAVIDIEMLARVAHEDARVPLIIDNTLATPYLLRPSELGADIIIHSATKYLAGHGAVIGGVIVDAARFDYGAEPSRWPGMHEPDSGHGELGYWDRFGGEGLAFSMRLRTTLLKDYGPSLSPFNSFMILQGLETLSLRMEKHVANAERVVAYLRANHLVEQVYYPTSPGTAWSETATKTLTRGAGGIVSFDIIGGLTAGRAVVNAVRIFSHLANIGDVRSLIIHPASTTHSGLSEEGLRVAGLGPGLIRLSVGIEDPDDLIADLEYAINASAPHR